VSQTKLPGCRSSDASLSNTPQSKEWSVFSSYLPLGLRNERGEINYVDPNTAEKK
jgi:hypothetical protein